MVGAPRCATSPGHAQGSDIMTEKPALQGGGAMSGLVAKAVEYMVDAGQRSVLFLDIMRQRGDQYREHVAQTAPHVLSYAAELIIDGRKLEQPVNYVLVRIIPPKGVEIDHEAPAVRRRRSARRSWPRHWRLQGRQRDRRRHEGGTSLLLHRLPARAHAGPDHRVDRARRSDLPREGDRAASRRPTASRA